MTLDAMYWVWLHSQSKGTGRHCLLAVANKAPGADCVASVSTAEFVQWSNAAKSSVVTAVDKLLQSGELKLIQPASGSRAAVYALPLAVGYKRPKPGSLGPVSGPREDEARSGNETKSDPSWSGNRTESPEPLGPETGPSGSGNRTNKGPETGPLYQSHSPKRERAIDAPASGASFPEFARPLADQLQLAGVHVRWPFNPGEWTKLHAAILKSGIPALVEYGRRTWDRQRGDIDSARYFLRGWCELAPLPSPDAERPPLHAINTGSSNSGWQPYSNPTDHSVYENGWT
ncbi:hypothetical protein ABH930_000279 [Kitasatospora sp. GAS204A]|uniref:hypothetical protein n=1 Tax=unclassified Kitasatospora TaxID=2633591 RepID=UPI0024744DC6|nr:hypothetical protein [Kitasatospora sp. GAS204B]MDH6116860.1 hypothetical protein [Kitasatospora sp. GAS204B]